MCHAKRAQSEGGSFLTELASAPSPYGLCYRQHPALFQPADLAALKGIFLKRYGPDIHCTFLTF